MPNNPYATVRRLSRLRAKATSLHGDGNREQENHPLRKSFDSAIMRTVPRRGVPHCLWMRAVTLLRGDRGFDDRRAPSAKKSMGGAQRRTAHNSLEKARTKGRMSWNST